MLGRDPEREALTDLETELFYRATLEHVEREFNPRQALSEMTGVPMPSSD